MRKIIFTTIINILFAGICANSQGLLPMPVNNVLKNTKQAGRLKAVSNQVLTIPFFDDFAGSRVYPDQTKWNGFSVYVNNQYGVNQPSVYVATFDGYDQNGNLYNFDMGANPADTLESKPIDLTQGITTDDTLFLSYYYQKGAFFTQLDSSNNKNYDEVLFHAGDKDTLYIDYYMPANNAWYSMDTLTAITPGTQFIYVQKAVPDSFWQEGFKFRFRNVSFRYSNDNYYKNHPWHIDYVKLDVENSKQLPLELDLAFYDRPQQLFSKNYRAVPWHHFEQAQSTIFRNIIEVPVRNFWYTQGGIDVTNFRYDLAETFSGTDIADAGEELDAKQRIENYTYNLQMQRRFSFDKNDTDSGFIKITHKFTEIWPDEPQPLPLPGNELNNTYSAEYPCYDYYAYDDGTAEYYAPEGGENQAKFAFGFTSFVPDSLWGVDILFVIPYDSSVLNKGITLRVLADNKGKPGDIIWEGDDFTIDSLESGRSFRRFYFNSSNPIMVDDNFYIELTRNGEYNLGIGVDINNSPFNLWENTAGGSTIIWNKRNTPGAFMVRPLMGKKKARPVGVTHPVITTAHVNIYPNPANRVLNISTADNSQPFVASIYDLNGKSIIHGITNNQTDISQVQNGVYILWVQQGTSTRALKLIVAH